MHNKIDWLITSHFSNFLSNSISWLISLIKFVEFIKKLRKHSEIIVQTNGISTQVFGDYDNISKALNQEIKNSFKNNKSIVFNMKIINSDLQEIPVF